MGTLLLAAKAAQIATIETSISRLESEATVTYTQSGRARIYNELNALARELSILKGSTYKMKRCEYNYLYAK